MNPNHAALRSGAPPARWLGAHLAGALSAHARTHGASQVVDLAGPIILVALGIGSAIVWLLLLRVAAALERCCYGQERSASQPLIIRVLHALQHYPAPAAEDAGKKPEQNKEPEKKKPEVAVSVAAEPPGPKQEEGQAHCWPGHGAALNKVNTTTSNTASPEEVVSERKKDAGGKAALIAELEELLTRAKKQA